MTLTSAPARPQLPAAGPAGGGAPGAGPLRRWRGWLLAVVAVGLAATAIALLHQPQSNQYLSPDSVSSAGARALADVLTQVGRRVTVATSVPAATASATAGTTLLVTSPQYLSPAQLAAISRVPADVVLVQPDSAALRLLAPGGTLVGPSRAVRVTSPGCALPAAKLAGTADMGGQALRIGSPAGPGQQCYAQADGPTLVQVRAGGRLLTVLATGAPLTNEWLASEGDAALAINLLDSPRIVWLVPPPVVPAAAGATAAGPRSWASLVPLAAYLVAAQLGFALLLAVAWRVRRLGALVYEPLPVVVRAAETVEGHGHLYQSRHARAQAAASLRAAALSRITRAVGLPTGAGRDAVLAALSERPGADPARAASVLYDASPRSDRDLVSLAAGLDELEREVGTT